MLETLLRNAKAVKPEIAALDRAARLGAVKAVFGSSGARNVPFGFPRTEAAKQLCEVLDYLHTRTPPIIYRDMKPANIMLKPDGTVKLIEVLFHDLV